VTTSFSNNILHHEVSKACKIQMDKPVPVTTWSKATHALTLQISRPDDVSTFLASTEASTGPNRRGVQLLLTEEGLAECGNFGGGRMILKWIEATQQCLAPVVYDDSDEAAKILPRREIIATPWRRITTLK
jgi:hypothetical protein